MTRESIRLVAILVALNLLFPAMKLTADSRTENFDTDPGWAANGLPVNNNDFGFRQSSNAGGDPGEAGGYFSATDRLVWYGDNSIGNVSAEQVISASGILNIASVDAGNNNNVFIGHFTADDTTLSNAIGFQILEEPSGDQGVNPSSFRIFYKLDTVGSNDFGIHEEGPLFVITNTGETRDWRYHYDPADGDYGSLTVSISGTGGNTGTVFLGEEQRQTLLDLDTFGMAVGPQNQRPQQLELYIDNVTYSTESTSPRYPRVSLDKSADNMTPSGDELVNFAVEISNSGDAAAEQVEVLDKLPPDMAIPEGMAAFTSLGYYDPATGIWAVGSLDVDQEAMMTLPAQIITVPQPPCVVNRAEVNTPGVATKSDEVVLRRPDISQCVDLTIELRSSYTVTPIPCAREQAVVYEFEISSGPSVTAQNVTLTVTETDYKAPGFKASSPQCEGLVCTWPTLEGTEYVSFESEPFAPNRPVTHRIEASVAGADGEIEPENNSLTATINLMPRSPNCPRGGDGMDFGGVGGGGGGCFISTAAYGSGSHADVQVLRDFRDEVLLHYQWGRALVDFYYRHSPDLACVVEEYPALQLAIRSVLKPVVLVIAHPWRALALLVVAAALIFWSLFALRRHRGT